MALVVLVASLGAVVWRQSRALDASEALAVAELERDAVEAEIAALVERIQQLESRGRVLREAKDRLGMRVPGAEEIVILPVSEVGESPRCLGAAGGCTE